MNATTALRPEAQEAWLSAQQDSCNPASSHRAGQQARARADEARRDLAALLSAKPHEFIFTGSGTESINLALHTAVLHHSARANEECVASNGNAAASNNASNGVMTPCRIVASAIDHSAVMRGAQRIPACHLSLLAVDSCGRLETKTLRRALTDDADEPVAMVCLQWANNELGTLQDLRALITEIRATSPNTLVMVDACQGIGKAVCNLADWDADLVAASAHKFGGPRGVGLLWHRVGTRIASQINGGRQQDDRRSGTEDVAGACATVAALRASLADLEHHDLRAMLDQMVHDIRQEIPEVVELAATANRLSNTCNLACPGIKAQGSSCPIRSRRIRSVGWIGMYGASWRAQSRGCCIANR